MPEEPSGRIRSIIICQDHLQASALLVKDRERALKDLEKHSMFQPILDQRGPYDIHLSTQDNRLIFHIENSEQKPLQSLVLSLKPYRRLIKDYFLIVDSYEDALTSGNPSRIEAIDMGRRSLHNEGAELLKERLEDKVMIDMDTARRLFTLICVLHSEPSFARR